MTEDDDQDAPATTERRARSGRFTVGWTPTEHAALRDLAAAAGLSISRYVTLAALTQPVKARADRDMARALLHTAADLARLGNLLMLWLSERPGQAAPEMDVTALHAEIRAAVRLLTRQSDRLI